MSNIQLPRYKCHKEVWALKIAAIGFEENGSAKIAPVDKRYAIFDVKNYRVKFKGDENDPGYYVQYEDGYQSWSPTKAFEEGYTLIDFRVKNKITYEATVPERDQQAPVTHVFKE